MVPVKAPQETLERRGKKGHLQPNETYIFGIKRT